MAGSSKVIPLSTEGSELWFLEVSGPLGWAPGLSRAASREADGVLASAPSGAFLCLSVWCISIPCKILSKIRLMNNTVSEHL